MIFSIFLWQHLEAITKYHDCSLDFHVEFSTLAYTARWLKQDLKRNSLPNPYLPFELFAT